MSLPFLFRAAAVAAKPGELYFDGGFTSNLPAWPYDAQRIIDPDLYTIGVEILDFEINRRWLTRLRNWLGGILAARRTWFNGPFRDLHDLAKIFGARALEVRRTRNASVLMDPGLQLLEFNVGLLRAHKIIHEGRLSFRASMNRRIARRLIFQEVCRGMAETVREYLREPAKQRVDAGLSPCIRVALLQPTHRTDS